MTIAEVQTLRDKYFTELTTGNAAALMATHSVEGQSTQHDAHLELVQKLFNYYDNLLIKKQAACITRRLNQKVL